MYNLNDCNTDTRYSRLGRGHWEGKQNWKENYLPLTLVEEKFPPNFSNSPLLFFSYLGFKDIVA